MKIQRYKHDSAESYTLGATLTYELIKCRPRSVTRVYVSSHLEYTEGIVRLMDLCRTENIDIECSDKAFNILSPKGNCFVIGVFRKEDRILSDGNHIVLVNPSDAGNMGTIIRTAVGFGFGNIAVIKGGGTVDFYDPRVIRASMGAAFHVNVRYYDTVEDYIREFPVNKLYAFMLQSSRPLTEIEISKPYSLVFGNEATGLEDRYADFCTSVIIRHSDNIDSLNLPMAAGIAMYESTKEDWRGK